MSLIPKVKIGRKTKKNRFNVGAFTHGTSEIGYVMPSYSRNLINNASVHLGTRSVVRLSPLFVPTMGDLSLRHYHCFVPFNKMWTPFDAFLDKKPFAFPNGYSQIPTDVPHFVVGVVLRHLLQNVDIFDYDHLNTLRSGLVAKMYYRVHGSSNTNWNEVDYSAYQSLFNTMGDENEKFNRIWLDNNLTIQGQNSLVYGALPSFLYVERDGELWENLRCLDGDFSGTEASFATYGPLTQISDRYYSDSVKDYLNQLSVPTVEACDFCVEVEPNVSGSARHDFLICYNFNGAWKRLRSIFLGLGYCFNPFDSEFVTPFKLLAFYRCYWSLFGVNRNVNFQDTLCAILTREISNKSGGLIDEYSALDTTLQRFISQELINCTYTTPADYFSSSVTNTQQGIVEGDGTNQIKIDSLYGNIKGAAEGVSAYKVGATAQANATQQGSNEPANPTFRDTHQSTTAIGMELAMRLMRWINRRTVVGSAIYDGLRSLYGNIQVNDESTEGVIRIGEDTTSVDIGAIYNQSDFVSSSGAPLGSFAGVGNGRSQSMKYYNFEAPSFGCIITLTAVVPQMGYFQGMLRENSDGVKDSYEMYDPNYDAVGWQSVRYNELAADRQFMLSSTNNMGFIGTALGLFGAQPRYTHMKCGFARVLGDISLPHMQDSMLPYTLDRFFPQRKPLPANVPQSFRSATRGETNRIFQVVSPTDDHVIWQIYFDVDMFAPMKSISESYDTFNPDDDSSIEVSHE